MGILNVTPDSFSDGGRFRRLEDALDQARRMVDAGAAIIDVGGESTRPGAQAVGADEEQARVVPIIERLTAELAVPISVDTSKPEVMRAAVRAGAGLINDVFALRRPHALETAASLAVPVCVMHMLGEPRTMQQQPVYGDVVSEVHGFLAERVQACAVAGIPPERVLVDPGFGFGKTLAHNLQLLKHLERLQHLGGGLLVGISRKSMIGAVLDAPVEGRLHGSVAAGVLAAWKGARVIRVHDVAATVDALRVVQAVREA